MATGDYLPGKFLDPTLASIQKDWLRDYQLRNPGADTGQGSQPYLDALTAANAVLPLYARATIISGTTNWTTSSGTGLDAWLLAFGTYRLPAVGAVGSVQISASAGGTFIQANDELTVNGLVYAAVSGGFYNNGAEVPVYGITKGPQTDQDAGTVLTWSTPRPGLNPQAAVVLQPDGTGLSGGANVETDAAAKLRLSYLKSNPPGSGNDAHIQWLVSKTPGLAIQQCFTYPAIMGPGTTGVTFTLRPAQSGGNRLPSSTALTIALGYLQQMLPASDGIFMCTLTGYPLDLIFEVQWASNAPSWADPSPFPLYQSPGNNWVVTSTVTPTPSTFNIMSATDTTVPQPGQNIGFLNLGEQEFSQKRILTATAAGGGYTIVVDPSNGVSDLTYAPQIGQIVSPWSASLDSLIAPVLAYLDSFGPGEQVSSFFDAGLRQKRSPPNPAQWACTVNNRILGGPPNAAQPPSPNAAPTPTLLSSSAIGDIELEEINGTSFGSAGPYATPVGNPAVSSNLLVLASIAAFPEP